MPSDITHSSFCNWVRFKHLVLIDTLARTRNMHTTAIRMNLTSQPALSKMLRDLEEQFGFALFQRLPRSMPPTELGEYVVRYAQRCTGRFAQVRRSGQSAAQRRPWLFKVGGIFAATSVVLPEAIVAIKARSPYVVHRSGGAVQRSTAGNA